MGKYLIEGGGKLSGSIKVSGSKNGALPILAATFLVDGQCTIENVPQITDIFYACEILRSLGCHVTFEKNTVVICTDGAKGAVVSSELASKMRSSIIFMGSILGKLKECEVPSPGGCVIGLRPTDLHTKALRALGAEITESGGITRCKAKKLHGAKISLDSPSVGATENALIVAAVADGVTQIINAAKEPEIVSLAEFLNRCGAKIKGHGTGTIVVEGVKSLHGTRFTIPTDRIVAGTYLVAAAITKSTISLENDINADILPITLKLREAGCKITDRRGEIKIKPPKELTCVSRIITQPHPGFPTDMQPQMAALLSTAGGTSIITERLFEGRNSHIPGLTKMGADITYIQEGNTSIINGVQKLNGADVCAYDLRCGAALILAGLAANGTTVVHNSEFVERGYDGIENDLVKLGASVKLVD